MDAGQSWISCTCIYFSALLPPNHRSRGPALAHVRITRADQPSLRILAASISSFSWSPGWSAHQHEKHLSTFKQGSRFSTSEKSSSSWPKSLQTLATVCNQHCFLDLALGSRLVFNSGMFYHMERVKTRNCPSLDVQIQMQAKPRNRADLIRVVSYIDSGW